MCMVTTKADCTTGTTTARLTDWKQIVDVSGESRLPAGDEIWREMRPWHVAIASMYLRICQ